MDIQIQSNRKGIFIFRLKKLKNPLKKFLKKKFISFPIHKIYIYQDQENSNYLKILIEIDSIVHSEFYYNVIAHKIFNKLGVNFFTLDYNKNNCDFNLELLKNPYFFYSEVEIFRFYSSIIVDFQSRSNLKSFSYI